MHLFNLAGHICVECACIQGSAVLPCCRRNLVQDLVEDIIKIMEATNSRGGER